MTDPRWTADGNGVGRGDVIPGWEAGHLRPDHDRFVMAPFVADALNDADTLRQIRGIDDECWPLGHTNNAMARIHALLSPPVSPEGEQIDV